MLISCPKCNIVYDVADDLLPEQGRKLRCARCGNVWLGKPEDRIQVAGDGNGDIVVGEISGQLGDDDIIETSENQIVAEEPQTESAPVEEKIEEKPSEATEIMSKLADQNDSIFRVDKNIEDIEEKTGIIHALGLDKKSTRTMYFLMFFLIVFLSLFYARYEITRTLPFMGKVYAALRIKSTIPGYGLEFQNVTRREFEEDYIHKLEIKGFVANTSTHMVDVPVIRIEMLDKDTNVLQNAETRVPVSKLAPEGRISFTALIIKPSTFTSYVLLTFIDEY